MLPFTKRQQRRSDIDTLSSGDFEVVHASTANQILRRVHESPRVTESPRVFERSMPDDEDRTLLMSSKIKSTPPPAPVERAAPIRKPEPPPALKGLVRRRLDTEDRTFLRPRSAMAIETFLPKPKTPAMMPTPYMALKPQQFLPAAPPANTTPLPAAKGAHREPKTDPRFEVPAAVITTRTRILAPKQTWSWGAALIGLGIAAGLTSAIVARGDADSLLDATARIVDPSGTHAAGATPQTIAPLAMAAAAATAPMATPGFASTPVMMGAQPAVQTTAQPVAIAPPPKLPDPSLAKPEPPRPAPVAWAAPVRHAQAQRAWQPAAQPASQPAAAAAPPAPRPAQQQVATARPAPGSKGAPAPKGSEMENASAADALAKAQLEASLR